MAKFNLEDAAKNHAGIPLNRVVDSEERYFNSSVREYDSFIEGANCMKETMYSKEEVIAFGWLCREKALTNVDLLFEGFKNK